MRERVVCLFARSHHFVSIATARATCIVCASEEGGSQNDRIAPLVLDIQGKWLECSISPIIKND
eukprot:1141403-Pelagomonas_calceolata.AAC.2